MLLKKKYLVKELYTKFLIFNITKTHKNFNISTSSTCQNMGYLKQWDSKWQWISFLHHVGVADFVQTRPKAQFVSKVRNNDFHCGAVDSLFRNLVNFESCTHDFNPVYWKKWLEYYLIKRNYIWININSCVYFYAF